LTSCGAINFTECQNDAAAANWLACTAGFDRDRITVGASFSRMRTSACVAVLAQNGMFGGVHPVELENVISTFYPYKSANLFTDGSFV